jgi:beta-glucosidase/6-phospho-beta-glucosidase/beta-galactosidase
MLVHRDYGSVIDNTTGDIAAGHYYLYRQDFARLAALGIPWFSMSISWSRIFPFGRVGSPVNEQGVAHYDDVFMSMLEYGIKPAVTLYHWDTPLALHNAYGAWTSEQIVEDFINYAIFIISRYDDYVPIWYTFNERE